VKFIRNISPLISALLILIVLSGSMGFTVIRHTCHHCGVQKISTSLTAASADDRCCCGHDNDIASPGPKEGEYVFSHDCCSLETERIVTDQVVRTEMQSEIMPCFTASIIISVIPEHNLLTVISSANNPLLHNGRELMTMHCQILS